MLVHTIAQGMAIASTATATVTMDTTASTAQTSHALVTFATTMRIRTSKFVHTAASRVTRSRTTTCTCGTPEKFLAAWMNRVLPMACVMALVIANVLPRTLDRCVSLDVDDWRSNVCCLLTKYSITLRRIARLKTAPMAVQDTALVWWNSLCHGPLSALGHVGILEQVSLVCPPHPRLLT